MVVGAIGQVWRLRIPFVHVDGADAFAAFAEPGYVKVAWAIRLSPLDEGSTRLELEVRVSATDDAAWRRFRRYFRLIGPASRYIRRSLLRTLGRELGRAEPGEDWPLAVSRAWTRGPSAGILRRGAARSAAHGRR